MNTKTTAKSLRKTKQTPFTLGAEIKRMREARSLTQTVLAKRIGISQGSLAHFETGKGYPSIETLCALASALDTSPARFFASDNVLVFDLEELSKYRVDTDLPDKLYRDLNRIVKLGMEMYVGWQGP